MNSICVTCDTRLRLNMCNGKGGNFKYCFRKCGSIKGLKETIAPFTSIEELYDINYIKDLQIKELRLENYNHKHMKLLIGTYKDGSIAPVGFVVY